MGNSDLPSVVIKSSVVLIIGVSIKIDQTVKNPTCPGQQVIHFCHSAYYQTFQFLLGFNMTNDCVWCFM